MTSRTVTVGAALIGALAVAPVVGQVDAVADVRSTSRQAARVLAALDRVTSAEEYDSLVEPLHGRLHAARVEWMRNALAAAGPARSRIVDSGVVGGRGVALVHSVFGQGPSRLETDRFVAFRTDGDELRAILDVEVDTEHLSDQPLTGGREAKFGCTACNYVMQPAADWLIVPHENEAVGCLEAFSFYSLQAPISVAVSVHVTRGGQSPETLLAGLVRANTDSRDVVGELVPWRPTRYRAADGPRGLEGARVEITDARKDASIVHSLQFGPVTYLFTANGPRAELQAERERVSALLDSFMLRETDLGRVQATVRPVMAHTGGEFDGPVYHNPRLGIRLRGPDGWSTVLHCGGHLAHASWTCEERGDRLTLRVLAPPPGHAHWTATSADASIECCLASNPVTVEHDGGWRSTGGRAARDLRFESDASGTARHMRALRPDDGSVLIVIDARAGADRLPKLVRLFDDIDCR